MSWQIYDYDPTVQLWGGADDQFWEKWWLPSRFFGVSAGSPRFQTKPRSLQHSSRLIFTNFKDQLILSKVFKPWNPTDYHHVPHKTCHLGIYPPEISPVRRREPDDPMQTAWALGSTGHDFGWILCGFWGLTGAFNPQRCVWTLVQRSVFQFEIPIQHGRIQNGWKSWPLHVISSKKWGPPNNLDATRAFMWFPGDCFCRSLSFCCWWWLSPIT